MQEALCVTLLLVVILSSGCATPQKMNDLSIGMTKGQVIELLGQPHSTSGKGNVQYLNYRLYDINDPPEQPYFVCLVDGKVESYGRLGDLDSTKPPEIKSTVDLKIQEK